MITVWASWKEPKQKHIVLHLKDTKYFNGFSISVFRRVDGNSIEKLTGAIVKTCNYWAVFALKTISGSLRGFDIKETLFILQ